MINIKEREHEIIGRALDVYRDSTDIDIDVKDFTNVAVATVRAIEKMETGKDVLDRIKLEVYENQDRKMSEMGKKLIGEYFKHKVSQMDDKIDLNKASFEIDDILYKKLKPIKDAIRKKIKSYPFHGSDYIKLNGDIKEDTIKMFEYVMSCTDVDLYDKAYVMQSVIDRVMSVYFDTLKEINKDINIL